MAFSLQGSLKQEGSWTLDTVFHCCGGCECLLDCAAFMLFRFVILRNKLNLQRLWFQAEILHFCKRKALLTSEWDRELGNERAERKKVIVFLSVPSKVRVWLQGKANTDGWWSISVHALLSSMYLLGSHCQPKCNPHYLLRSACQPKCHFHCSVEHISHTRAHGVNGDFHCNVLSLQGGSCLSSHCGVWKASVQDSRDSAQPNSATFGKD